MDYYGILGVSSTAELSEIKSKFKKLALLYHPDKPTGNDEKFKEINEAYKVLVNEKEREEYDRKRAESKSTYGYRSTNYSFFETVRREHERQQREMERERMAKDMERERIEREKRERKAREEMENRKRQEAEIQRRLEKIRLKEIEVERREKEIRRRRELEIKMEAMKLNNNSQQDDGMKTNQDPESSDNQSEQPEEEQESEEESDSTSSSDVISQYYSPEESHSQYADFLEEEINNVQDQHSEEEQSDIEIIDTDTKGSKESPIVIDDDSATPGNSRATTSHKRRKTGYSAGPSNSNKKRKRIVSHGHRSANAAHVNKRHKSTNDERQLLFERIASAQTFPEFFAPSIDFETQCLHSLSEKIDLQILNDLQVVAERQLKLLKEFIAQYDHS